MIYISSLLKNVHEYNLVKRLTTQPLAMKEAYECKLDPAQADALLKLIMPKWRCNIPANEKLSSKPIKIIWNWMNGKARGGYMRSKDGTLRPYLKLPLKDLTAGLVLHEYCHVVTIYLEKDNRKQKGNKRHSPHGECFRSIFDVMLVMHKQDYLSVKKNKA